MRLFSQIRLTHKKHSRVICGELFTTFSVEKSCEICQTNQPDTSLYLLFHCTRLSTFIQKYISQYIIYATESENLINLVSLEKINLYLFLL